MPTLPVPEATVTALRALRERFPDAPFLTLGQTVLWDEPVKAALCRVLQSLEARGEIAPGARFVAGVHDTDYFAKLEGLAVKDDPFIVLRHNDGDTRGLWSAAGELSALFGAEIVPSRADLAGGGVSLRSAARAYPGGLEALLNQETDAPLWRALVHTEPHPLIAADVKLAEILPALRQQLRWGFRRSLEINGCSPEFELGEPCPSREVARRVLGWVEEFSVLEPQATLSDLYRDLIPKIWALVGGATCRLETTTSLELFRFNTQTCSHPRFQFLDLFLNPATRALARRCYDDAVRGSGIYTLDEFGPGALPFDVVVPGEGRGTLRLHDGKIIVETETPREICQNCDPDSVARLAALLETHFGPETCVVGKAVSLISMLAAEFIFVFHERASGYTSRTQAMNAAMRAQGLRVTLHPMLRLRYEAWDALAGVDAEFRLPPHLEKAWGRANLSAHEFATSWKAIAQQEDERRARLKAIRKPDELMRALGEQGGTHWAEKRAEYLAAGRELAQMRQEANVSGASSEVARQQARQMTRQACDLEREKGVYFRAHILPLQRRISDIRQAAHERERPLKPSREERAAWQEQETSENREIEALQAQLEDHLPRWKAFDAEIEAARVQARLFKQEARRTVLHRLQQERSPHIEAARARRHRLENEAELARFFLVRDAFRAAESLRLTNVRPTAWWLPMVSPGGHWFNSIASSAQARLEEL